jgi:hypothetical protein
MQIKFHGCVRYLQIFATSNDAQDGEKYGIGNNVKE